MCIKLSVERSFLHFSGPCFKRVDMDHRVSARSDISKIFITHRCIILSLVVLLVVHVIIFLAQELSFYDLAPIPRPSKPISTDRNSATNVTIISRNQTNCVLISSRLETQRELDLKAPSWDELENKFRGTGISPGGRWKPTDCMSRAHVAIIIPFRDRYEHLRVFLNNMHPMLQKQMLHYGIYIVDQREGSYFNRGMLMNVGFVEAGKVENYDCFIFHDVDLLAENEQNMYRCGKMPTHMSSAVDKFHYRQLYPYQFGGVSALTKEHMHQVNGYPNAYFGWGGEDDDMSSRVRSKFLKGMRLVAVDRSIGRYKMIKHETDHGNPRNSLSLKLYITAKERFATDGLNTLKGKYLVLKVDQHLLYTRIYVDLDAKGILKDKQFFKFRTNKWLKTVLQLSETFATTTPNTNITRRLGSNLGE